MFTAEYAKELATNYHGSKAQFYDNLFEIIKKRAMQGDRKIYLMDFCKDEDWFDYEVYEELTNLGFHVEFVPAIEQLIISWVDVC